MRNIQTIIIILFFIKSATKVKGQDRNCLIFGKFKIEQVKKDSIKVKTISLYNHIPSVDFGHDTELMLYHRKKQKLKNKKTYYLIYKEIDKTVENRFFEKDYSKFLKECSEKESDKCQ